LFCPKFQETSNKVMFLFFLAILGSLKKVSYATVLLLPLYLRFSSFFSLAVPANLLYSSFHGFSQRCFPLALLSLLLLRKAYATGVWFCFFWKRGKEVRLCRCTHAATAIIFGKRKGHLPSLFCIYTPY